MKYEDEYWRHAWEEMPDDVHSPRRPVEDLVFSCIRMGVSASDYFYSSVSVGAVEYGRVSGLRRFQNISRLTPRGKKRGKSRRKDGQSS